MKKRSGFKLGGMSFGAGTGTDKSMMEEQGIMPKQENASSGFMKTSIDKKNRQKMFSKKASDLRRAWRSIKDPNSNRAKQLKQEAKTIGLTLEGQNTSPRGLNVDEVD